jgi:hypothetical protein
LIRCDPNFSEYSEINASQKAEVPERFQPIADTKHYKITDIVNTVPGGIWDSNIDSIAEYTNVENGIFIRTRSPLSVVIETEWSIKDTNNGDIELIRHTMISCSRVLFNIVKGQCEANLLAMHQAITERLSSTS